MTCPLCNSKKHTIVAGAIVVIFLFFGILFSSYRSYEKAKKDLVSASLDYQELKQHTDILAQIVTTQQYQLDVLTESVLVDGR